MAKTAVVIAAFWLTAASPVVDAAEDRWVMSNGRHLGAVATIGSYPGYDGPMTVSGTIYITNVFSTDGSEAITIHGTVAGVEANATGGIHVHTGVTCDDASEVYGHYYESSNWASDPWTTTYTSDSNGVANIDEMVLDDFSVTGTYPVAGRAFVIHASDGSRIGCGVLQGTAGAPVILDTYPGYSGEYENASATLLMNQSTTYDADTETYVSSITISGTVAGLETSAIGGIHVHEGYSCEDADAVGGHYYTSAYFSSDPWTTTYTTDSSGSSSISVTVDDFYLSGDQQLSSLYRTVVFHLASGTRVLCGVIGQPTTGVATMGSYPGYSGSLTVGGTVSFMSNSDDDLEIRGVLTGLTPSVTGGIHVHVGFTCEDETEVYGHYFGEFEEDPWLDTIYTSDANGVATVDLLMTGITLTRSSPIAGRAFVVHDNDGTRIGCGIIESTAGDVVNLGTYPGYDGEYGVNGTLLLTQTYKNLTIEGTVIGLESSATGGVHVHSGYSCDDADAVGGHYFTAGSDDPWITTYTSDSQGTAQVSIKMPSYSLDKASNALLSSYRTFVIHLSGDGTRAACGVIGTPTTAVASLGTYPGYTGNMNVTGTVVITDDYQGVVVYGTLSGLETEVTGGVHVHTGFSCDDASDVGGHYYTDHWDVDPWLTTTYSSDENGNAQIKFSVEDFSLAGEYPVAGRAFVVHASSGTRLACGLLESTVGEVITVGSYPGSDVSGSSPMGTALASPWETGIGFSLEGTLIGVEPSVTGGVFVGKGFNVDEENGPGDEFVSSETWSSSSYTSDDNGAATLSLSIEGLTIDDANPIAYRALVIEDSTGSASGAGLVSTDSAIVLSTATTLSPTQSPTNFDDSSCADSPTPQPTMVPTTCTSTTSPTITDVTKTNNQYDIQETVTIYTIETTCMSSD